MSRTRKSALAALVLILAVAPFLPRGGGDEDGAITPSVDQPAAVSALHATAGFGALTPDLRAEVDRVVGQGHAAARALGRTGAWTPRALARALARCADFEGQRYCLGVGWTHRSPAEVRDRVAVAAARRTPGERTGGVDLWALLRRTAALPTAQRARLERAELTMAARSVAKAWLLRHQVEGVPLPAGFLDRHPEVTTQPPGGSVRTAGTTSGTAPRSARAVRYPDRAAIMSPRRVSEQTRTYWCGPASMQMIAWGWSGRRHSQRYWAGRLRTTSSGTSIYDMARVTNSHTGWDRSDRAGPYIVLDVSDYGFSSWLTLIRRHIAGYRAPVILHPILLKRFFPYLDDDASGHFQVGRGYRKLAPRRVQVGYFEPWNQQRFDRSEPFIARVQWRSSYRSYRANLAHPQQNIGV